jgi:NADPH-dependent curcumin reductase CurA
MRGVAVGSRDLFEDMAAAIAQHRIHPVVHQVFDGLDSFTSALEELASGSHFGKVAVKVAP